MDNEANIVGENAGGGTPLNHDHSALDIASVISRSALLLPPAVHDYLDDYLARYSARDTMACLEQARSQRVLLIGEAIIDEYVYCTAIGKSSKEPTLAVKYLSTERFAGGILAAGNHVANFCDTVGLVTCLGQDGTRQAYVKEKLHPQISANLLVRRDSPTIVKRRYIDQYFFTKLFEVYEMDDGVMNPADDETLCATLEEVVPQYDVVIVIDYGHGMLGPRAVETICRNARFLAVNAQSNAANRGYHTISKYPRMDFLCVAEGEMRLEARSMYGDIHELVREVAGRLSCDRVITTRGTNGCLCYSPDGGVLEVPSFAQQVVDRIGAGDAFLSIAALCVAQGAPLEMAGVIGNAVGALAVSTVCNSVPIQRESLQHFLATLLSENQV
ncbi:MAG: PfkB family carbohydrate kinase [Armatimonadota bacterium]